MKLTSMAFAALMLALAAQAQAATANFTFNGPGVSGNILLTYGAEADEYYPDAYKVTSISGTFSNSNKGLNIVDAAILSLVQITGDKPEEHNLLAPKSFSRFPVGAGSLSYSNLFWPKGSVQTASDYTPHGGVLDIYGLLFNIGGGRVVNLWSDGDMGSGITYGVAVATSDRVLDYVFEGVDVAPVPLPAGAGLLASALAGLAVLRRRAKAA